MLASMDITGYMPRDWEPGELEAECARLQQMEERLEELARHWEDGGVPASDYAALLRDTMKGDWP
jgi:hypothetical protein